MIESMACGTPVIATRWGAVPEVIDHGRTGMIVDDWRQTAAALEAADALDPAEMRREVEERFTPERMVADYVAAYEAALASLESRYRGAWSANTAARNWCASSSSSWAFARATSVPRSTGARRGSTAASCSREPQSASFPRTPTTRPPAPVAGSTASNPGAARSASGGRPSHRPRGRELRPCGWNLEPCHHVSQRRLVLLDLRQHAVEQPAVLVPRVRCERPPRQLDAGDRAREVVVEIDPESPCVTARDRSTSARTETRRLSAYTPPWTGTGLGMLAKRRPDRPRSGLRRLLPASSCLSPSLLVLTLLVNGCIHVLG